MSRFFEGADAGQKSILDSIAISFFNPNDLRFFLAIKQTPYASRFET